MTSYHQNLRQDLARAFVVYDMLQGPYSELAYLIGSPAWPLMSFVPQE